MSDTLEETLPAHAPLGPSSAEGWATCSDYVNANRGLPDTTTEPAAEGTAAHGISDICLTTGLDADDLLGIVTEVAGFTFAWEEDDAMLLQHGIDKLRAAVGRGAFWGEHRVDISAWTLPGQFGTLDRAYIIYDAENDEWWIVVEDLKWGRGVAVSPVENKQIMLYALGFWAAIGRHQIPPGVVPRFRLIIDQPRHAGGGGVWETTLDDLLAFGEWIRERARLTAEPNPTRTASLKGCMWCRRRRVWPQGNFGGCDTYDTFMLSLLGWTWADVDIALMMGTDMTLPTEMTPERASFLLLHKDMIERWLKELAERMLSAGLAGEATGEVKPVEGNKSADARQSQGTGKTKLYPVRPVIERLLGDRGFTKMLKSPKQVLSLLTDDEDATKEVAQHIRMGTKKPTLVPLADARPAILAAQSMLDEEEEGD
ncbi:DUF2800 domain-containing protein [Sphingomonas hankookensis]|uniref:DUF2800 domain-containing protein n=1 Tax=Sphingomonas hankookensis TaxID=563996 RepID=UPI003D303DB0